MTQRTHSISALIASLALATLLSACGSDQMNPSGVSIQQAPEVAGSPAAGSPSPVANDSGLLPERAPTVQTETQMEAGVDPGVDPGVSSPSLPVMTGGNRAPTIKGTALTVVAAGQPYSFTPTASDADGDTLSYSISGKPSWATFELSTGKLTGTPSPSQVGQYPNVVISVSDGKSATALTAFTVNVNQISTGTVTLSWTPPTHNEDGSSLNNLAGYRIYYGPNPSALTQSVQITNPGLTSYVIADLGPGTTHFAMTAYSANGAESRQSALGSKTI